MVIYLYNHDISEDKENLPYLKNESGHLVDKIYCNAHKSKIVMIRYCEHCNSTLVGYWEYADLSLSGICRWKDYDRNEFEGKPLDAVRKIKLEKIAEDTLWWITDRYFANKTQVDIDSFCYDLLPCKSGEEIKFKFNEQRKQILTPILTISPEIIQYRKEIEEFFSTDTCPICNNKFVRHPNHHLCLQSPSNMYSNLCSNFPGHMFEEHRNSKHFSASDVPENIRNLPNGETFVHNNRLAIGLYGRKNEYWINYFNETLPSMLTYFNYFLENKFKEPAMLRVKEITEKFNVAPLVKKTAKISFDVGALKNYLNYVCQLEGNIFSVTERLQELYAAHFESKKDAVASQRILALELKKELKSKKEAYAVLEKSDPEKEISVDDFAFDYPKKPTAPEMPQKPILKTAGLFNKKKIEAENNLLIQQYQAQLTAYNTKMELYLDEMKKYNQTVEEAERKQKEMCSAKIAEVRKKNQDKLDILNKEVKDLETRIFEIEDDGSDIVTQEKIKNELVESEIREAEKLLCETYKALNELYSYDIIFSKYRNFVAVSAFYEYLSSGRCSALEGSDGAYNIYENEVRANMIVSQLSQVIDSLDKIQQNQYVIYSAIQESNNQLARLNSSMKSAISVLGNINVTTNNMSATIEKISEHTAIAAYNSSVTAFYSKKTAELTNALGYMVALN